jgi:hypothetical protein
MTGLDVVSERIGGLQASMESLEAWMLDHQNTEREVHAQLHAAVVALDTKIDEIHACVAAEKARQAERNRISGQISAAVAFLMSTLVAVGAAIFK